MFEDREGFIKLNKDNRRGSSFQYHHPNEYGCGLREDTRIRIHIGLGRCLNMNVKVEKEDGGNLRIGRLSLASNCHIIVLIFGFFFLLAGVVLTIISYKVPLGNRAQVQSSSREQGRIAGPAFIGVGSLFFLLGVTLCLIYWRLNKAEAKRVRIFSVGDAQEARSCPLTPSNVASVPSSRRESTFTTNYFTGRRKTLPSITPTIPEGFMFSSNGNVVRNGRSEVSTDPFGDDRLNVRDHHSFREASANSRRKASLSRRPSLASPNFMMRSQMMTPVDSLLTTRSDEPFGSIVSLGAKKLDIACFPSNQQPPQFAAETNSRLSPTSRDLPVITVNECANLLIQGNSLLNVNSLGGGEEISNV